MNKKIIWGILIIFMSLFYLFQRHIPENVIRYVFNYQAILMIIGILVAIDKNKIGWAIFGIGLYLYLKEFFGQYFDLGFPVILLFGGIVLFVLGINERKKIQGKKQRQNSAVFKSTLKGNTSTTNTKNVDIEDAEEIK